MTARTVLLKTHLWLGWTAGLFLLVLGLTGSIMAFEGDIDHWLHPSFWYVRIGPKPLPEEDLIRNVQQRFDPARVSRVLILRQPNLAQTMEMTDETVVNINPYDGTILGSASTREITTTQKVLGFIHQTHLRLVPDPRSVSPSVSKLGKLVVSFAGVILSLLVPTGMILWWRTQRFSIKWKAPWSRVSLDIHRAIGAYSALFLFIAAFTGVLIGFDFGERAIYSVTHSSPPIRQRPPNASLVPGGTPIGVGRALEIAKQAMPDGAIAGFQLPPYPEGRVPCSDARAGERGGGSKLGDH